MEDYIHALQEMNPNDVHVCLEKDAENRFVRYFIGIKCAVEVHRKSTHTPPRALSSLVNPHHAHIGCPSRARPAPSQALRKAGIDFFAIDACRTLHHIVEGMQLHILVARTGNNRNFIVGWSLEDGETSNSYSFFAREAKTMGFADLVPVPDAEAGSGGGASCCVSFLPDVPSHPQQTPTTNYKHATPLVPCNKSVTAPPLIYN